MLICIHAYIHTDEEDMVVVQRKQKPPRKDSEQTPRVVSEELRTIMEQIGRYYKPIYDQLVRNNKAVYIYIYIYIYLASIRSAGKESKSNIYIYIYIYIYIHTYTHTYTISWYEIKNSVYIYIHIVCILIFSVDGMLSQFPRNPSVTIFFILLFWKEKSFSGARICV